MSKKHEKQQLPSKGRLIAFVIIAMFTFVCFTSLVGSVHYIETIIGLVLGAGIAELVTAYFQRLGLFIKSRLI